MTLTWHSERTIGLGRAIPLRMGIEQPSTHLGHRTTHTTLWLLSSPPAALQSSEWLPPLSIYCGTAHKLTPSTNDLVLCQPYTLLPSPLLLSRFLPITQNPSWSQNNKLKLPISSLNEEFKVSRAREVLLYRESRDLKVSQAGIEVRTGRRAAEEVEVAESRLRNRELVGAVAHGRAGLGSSTTSRYNKAQGKDRRSLVQQEGRAAVEEERASRMVGMRQQGAWTRWEHAVDRKVTWAELWKAEPHRIRFLIQAVYDVLPSPSNLFSWGLVESPACILCLKRGTLEHILSCCSKALGEGRYRWRHDQVLKVIASTITYGIGHCKCLRSVKKTITFVRAGEKPLLAARATSSGLLATAQDWELEVDLGK
ncbi:hypothetical protein DPEC_G00178340 [Dallia pectoralis]|uniref:Uncharacterized protein n=1 Tax=Dallia pectoralis TaxID=75939 RepID=A0ACC2GF70_DALPE|nr:hypothetical protein DPEC_G00178340 [Dallia pectoralis]